MLKVWGEITVRNKLDELKQLLIASLIDKQILVTGKSFLAIKLPVCLSVFSLKCDICHSTIRTSNKRACLI